jgi:hypothetical protein
MHSKDICTRVRRAQWSRGHPSGRVLNSLVAYVTIDTPLMELAGHLRGGLLVGSRQRDDAGVDLDPRHDALALQDVDQRRAVGAALAQRLVKQDLRAAGKAQGSLGALGRASDLSA